MSTKKKFMSVFIIILICICGVVHADEEIEQLLNSSTDPFSSLLSPKPDLGLEQREQINKPSLFIENITLDFLEAENLQPVIGSMLSVFGSVSVDKKSNSLIVCDDAESIARITEQVNKTDQSAHQAVFAETVTLKFLDAESLQLAVRSMSSKYGNISVDQQTNSLIVCDARENLSRIVAEIKKADRMPEQVLIEVVILDVQLSNDNEIGVNWDNLFDSSANVNYEQNLVSTLASPDVSGGDFKILTNTITGTVHALQEKRDVEILATPKVLVLSGQEAMIQTVQEIPYLELTDSAEGGAGALSSTEFKEVGVTLTVKATVTEDGKIMLFVVPEQSVNTGRGGFDNRVPIIDKRTASTTLMLNDGQVAVLGGLRRSETMISEDQIPFLGDLPYVGVLFSQKKKEIINSELIVMLSPKIYRGESPTAKEMERFEELSSRPYLELREEVRPELEALDDLLPEYEKQPRQWE